MSKKHNKKIEKRTICQKMGDIMRKASHLRLLESENNNI